MNFPHETSPPSIQERLKLFKRSLSSRRRVPLSTYRLQFSKEFTFAKARSILEYLSRLGVSHCYASPYLAAGKESSHGYDICDYSRINPELGGEEEFKKFVAELSRKGMGHILDFVPNHMGIADSENTWWQDVLENGRCSQFADFFDIDWNPAKAEIQGKILLPVLGDPYGDVLERGELTLEYEEGAFALRYFNYHLPIDPRSVPMILTHNLDRLEKEFADKDPDYMEFLSIITALKNLPSTTETSPQKIAERHREKEVNRERLNRLVTESSKIREHIRNNLKIFNGNPEKPESYDLLHQLLECQVYRLSNWRTAAHEINYRRFFDINHLAGLRMEREEVFHLTHELVLKLIGEGKISGLRLDHPDGLFNPSEYFDRLQEAVLFEWVSRDPQFKLMDKLTLRELVRQWRSEEKERDPSGAIPRPLYVVVEKILTGPEILPEHWAVHGTSGYDFLNDLNGLFVDSSREKQFTRNYVRYTGVTAPFSEIVYQSKKLIMQTALTSELNVLVRALNLISEEDRHYRDFTLNSLREALTEVVAVFPIYRTYIDQNGIKPEDRETIEKSIARARQKNPALEPTIFDFLKKVMLLEDVDRLPEERREKRLAFVMKLQQFTAPVQAKGLEDTAFYRYNRLLSLNEVGGQPQRFGVSVPAFHARNQKRQKQWPWALLTTGTHDHKRGEDVRARINILSEIPDEWRKAVRRWSMLNRTRRTLVDGAHAPDRNDEYLFYQTLVGMWPAMPCSEIPRDEVIFRLKRYMHKATKEAKVHTSWINPNEAYDAAVEKFIEKTLRPSRTNRFLESFVAFQRKIAKMGVVNSLSQVMLKMTSPGIPDVYQGCETWDLSLVDPDNRVPVDFRKCGEMLDELEPLLFIPLEQDDGNACGKTAELLDNWEDGRIKMFVTAQCLRLRKKYPSLFLEGEYIPLQVDGEWSEHVVAFARQKDEDFAIVVVPRLVARLMQPHLSWPVGEEVWENTSLLVPAGISLETKLRDHLTGRKIPVHQVENEQRVYVGDILSVLPHAILGKEIQDK